MPKAKTAIVDVDDLWCEEQIIQHLLPLKEKVPGLVVTAYTIPNKMGPVQQLKERYPWLIFGIHGWEHTFCECLEWTGDKAHTLVKAALDMGYSPLFKPPNWRYDGELLPALDALGVLLHHHKKDRPRNWSGLRYGGPGKRRSHAYVHTHIERNASTDFIGEHPGFTPERLQLFEEFATPLDFGVRDRRNGDGE